jgi:ABC-2 type transport system permease protein
VPGRTRDTWVIFSEELRGYLRSRWYLISTAVVVVLLIIAMVAVPALSGGDKTPESPTDNSETVSRIGFVDQTSRFAGLAADGGPHQFADQAQGLEALSHGEIDWLYVIPADYLKTSKINQYGEFAGRFPSNPAGEAAFTYLLTEELLVAEGVDPKITARTLAPADFQNYRMDEDGNVSGLPPTAQELGGLLVPLLFAALLGVGLAVGAGNMVQSVSEEKESRLIEVVITSVSPSSFMAGKLLALVTVGLTQAAIWIIAAALTVPVMFRGIPGVGEFTVSAGLWLTIVGCFITGYFLIATLAILVGAIAPSSRAATGLGSWLSIIEFVPLWFSGFIMWQPDGLLGKFLSYFPFTASSGILVRLSGDGQMAAWMIIVDLIGVAILAAIVLWVSIRVFRAAILMRGQSFTAGNLWRATRRAG